MIERTEDIYCDSCNKHIDCTIRSYKRNPTFYIDKNLNYRYYKTGSKKFIVTINVSAIDYENSIPQGTKERTDLCDTCLRDIIASIDPKKLKSSRSRALMEDTQ